MRPKEHRAGLAHVEIEGVPHPTRRMGGRDVESLEVVPVGLDLGTVRYRKSHSEKHVFQLVAGALDEVEMADRSDRSEIRSHSDQEAPSDRGGQPRGSTCAARSSSTARRSVNTASISSSHLTEQASRFAPFSRVQRAEPTVCLSDLGSLAEQLDLGRVEAPRASRCH